MVRDRTAKDVMQEIIKIADGRRLTDGIRGDARGGRLNEEQNAELVGQIVKNLSEEDRALLADIKPEDILYSTSWHRPRPEKPVRRVRGPVRLGKK